MTIKDCPNCGGTHYGSNECPQTWIDLDHCLACGGTDLQPYFDAGSQPLANAFTDDGTKLPTYPLGLNLCKSCWHSQQKVSVNPDLLFRDYAYVSGTSGMLDKYFRGFVNRVENDFTKRNNGSLRKMHVLDIACNDGSLLGHFSSNCHAVFGVDPAENLVSASAGNGPIYSGYWDEETVNRMVANRHNSFDVIIAMNVLGHVRDPLKFLQLCKTVLTPGGMIYIQTSQAHMVADGQFDTCYHEHLSFFTMNSFHALAKRAGLTIEKSQITNIHGGSYLVEMSSGQDKFFSDGDCGDELLQRDLDVGLYDQRTYDEFEANALLISNMLETITSTAIAYGYGIVGFGAAAKAVTFMNFAAFNFVDYVVDENTLKIGKRCPGNNIEVKAPSAVAEDGREKILFVILAWNFADEIKAKIRALRPDNHDLFLTYFPELKVTR